MKLERITFYVFPWVILLFIALASCSGPGEGDIFEFSSSSVSEVELPEGAAEIVSVGIAGEQGGRERLLVTYIDDNGSYRSIKYNCDYVCPKEIEWIFP